MTNYIEIYADSARGQYIPQYFAESCKRDMVQGVSADDWAILESGPDNADYWEAWDSVLNNARITDSRGSWTLYQDGDLFLTHADYLDDDAKDSLVAGFNELTAAQVEYAESHKDAGDDYAHLPRESWTSSDDENLRQFLSDNGIDDCGLDIDAIAELALDNFAMRSENIMRGSSGQYFACGAYPVQEIEMQIDYAALTEACGFEVKRAHIEQLGNAPDSYIGSISDDSCLAYSTSDAVWLADISADKLASLIKEASESL